MSPSLQLELRSTFPLLYWSPEGDRYPYALFGIECNDGWYQILHKASGELHRLIKALPSDQWQFYKVDQIKEKWGLLRIYLSCETEEMDRIIREAETASETTCEDCGDPGKTRAGGWIRTLCDACHTSAHIFNPS